ncbi:hypothetical protein CDD80_7109 [Ophiocordyceps camponoti-rufipedis]|uniref:Fe2OG dioxygenase domain-containing protein n=1 Tax=Ophiocordyceps camponoti-rufipedis TaxID=2004952 RepID=A0A2C5YHI5_9HYPO|nr:hypothetical protein CDD80_7109 [Ophiocordyceps camponoti-rufipedis]
MSLPRSLDDARVSALPLTAYYVPDFISRDEERLILTKSWPFPLLNDKLLDAPLPSWLQEPIVPRLLSLPMSEQDERRLFSQSPHRRPNHVLVNEYPPGVGIMAHKLMCTVSLGASLCLDVYRSREGGALESTPTWRILQEPRSLLVTTDSLYTDYLHGIADVTEDVDLSPASIVNWSLLGDASVFADGRNARGTRTSLTYRDVIKVSKAGSKLGLAK